MWIKILSLRRIYTFFKPGYYSAKFSDWRILDSLPTAAKGFSLLQKTHPGPVVSTQSPIQWMGSVFTGIKLPGP
jgi:hypothetical protein